MKRGNKSRDAEPRAPGRLIHNKAVVVEAQPYAQVPFAEVNLVLSVGGRLNVPAVIRKGRCKRQLRPRIELRRICDRISQAFVHGVENSVHSEFPVVPPMMTSEIRAGVPFAI